MERAVYKGRVIPSMEPYNSTSQRRITVILKLELFTTILYYIPTLLCSIPACYQECGPLRGQTPAGHTEEERLRALTSRLCLPLQLAPPGSLFRATLKQTFSMSRIVCDVPPL